MRRRWWMVIAAAGLLAVWILPSGVLAQAEGEEGQTEEPAEDLDEEASTPAGVQRVTERLAQEFNVEADVVTGLRDEGLGFGEIHHALSLAEQLPGGATQENIDQIMSLRQEGMGWGEIAHEYDTTLGEVTRRGGPEPATTEPGSTTEPGTTEAQSLVRPGRSSSSGSEEHGWGRGGVTTSGIERSGSGGGGALRGSSSSASHGGGKSSSAPGHNR
ncbi:MAG: hypothetical protein HY353_03545 [Candidatus Omnitrophica bacterium]|nr:hypothetical protein [Candidatus Omnitrophota bacterium]